MYCRLVEYFSIVELTILAYCACVSHTSKVNESVENTVEIKTKNGDAHTTNCIVDTRTHSFSFQLHVPIEE